MYVVFGKKLNNLEQEMESLKVNFEAGLAYELTSVGETLSGVQQGLPSFG